MDQVIKGKFDGININYERVKPTDRNHFISFIKSLSEKLHSRNLLMCCSVGGRTSDTSVTAVYDCKEDQGADERKSSSPKPFIGFNWSKPREMVVAKPPAPTVSLDPGTGSASRRYKKMLATYCDQIHVMGYDEWACRASIQTKICKNAITFPIAQTDGLSRLSNMLYHIYQLIRLCLAYRPMVLNLRLIKKITISLSKKQETLHSPVLVSCLQHTRRYQAAQLAMS